MEHHGNLLHGCVNIVNSRARKLICPRVERNREELEAILLWVFDAAGNQRQRPIRRHKLGPWMGVIDGILNEDKMRPAKQRQRVSAFSSG